MSTVVPKMGAGGNLNVTTAGTGTTWTALAAQTCKQVTIANNTGTAVEVRQDAGGVGFPVFDATYYTFYGLSDASQIQIRRVDTSNTQVVVNARWEA